MTTNEKSLGDATSEAFPCMQSELMVCYTPIICYLSSFCNRSTKSFKINRGVPALRPAASYPPWGSSLHRKQDTDLHPNRYHDNAGVPGQVSEWVQEQGRESGSGSASVWASQRVSKVRRLFRRSCRCLPVRWMPCFHRSSGCCLYLCLCCCSAASQQASVPSSCILLSCCPDTLP